MSPRDEVSSPGLVIDASARANHARQAALLDECTVGKNGGENLAMAKITHVDARTWRLT